MSALLAPSATPDTAARFDHLDWLEAEAIFILREVAAQCAAPALLFSGGKDQLRPAAPGGEGLPAAGRFRASRCCTSTPGTTSPR